MTTGEWSLCLASVLASTTAQLFLKSGAHSATRRRTLLLVGVGGSLQLVSVLLAALVLRTLHLSQLIPFAASAYLLVPVGSAWILGEKLLPRFWIGAVLVAAGIICASG